MCSHRIASSLLTMFSCHKFTFQKAIRFRISTAFHYSFFRLLQDTLWWNVMDEEAVRYLQRVYCFILMRDQ
jgi:hypothetical protein